MMQAIAVESHVDGEPTDNHPRKPVVAGHFVFTSGRVKSNENTSAPQRILALCNYLRTVEMPDIAPIIVCVGYRGRAVDDSNQGDSAHRTCFLFIEPSG